MKEISKPNIIGMSIIILLILFLGLKNTNAQDRYNTDKDIFISYLAQENIIAIKDTVTKRFVNDFKYLDTIEIELDTIVEIPSVLNLILYKFQLGKNKIKIKSSNKKILFNCSSCDTYIIAINSENKNSYRLKGFNGNDLLFLLKEINKNLYKKRRNGKIVKELQTFTNEVDFICIYESIIKEKLDSKCLKPCKDAKPLHLSR